MMLEVRDLAFSYDRNKQVLRDITAEIAPGTFTAILGVNGCGKSTFLSCLVDLLKPQKGTVLIDGKTLSDISREDRAKQIGFVAQHSHANRLTVYDSVLLGRMPLIQGAPTDEDLAIVERVLDELDLGSLSLRYVDELSGGEYQKVILARAFVQQTNVLLLDEPTNNLDPTNQQEVMKIVRAAVDKDGLAAAAVLHDINLALRYCDKFIMIKDGSVAAYGGAGIIDESIIEDVYAMDVDIIEHKGHKVVIPI